MSLGDDLLKRINKKFQPSTKISMRYRSYDVLLVTDKEGNAIQYLWAKQTTLASSKATVMPAL